MVENWLIDISRGHIEGFSGAINSRSTLPTKKVMSQKSRKFWKMLLVGGVLEGLARYWSIAERWVWYSSTWLGLPFHMDYRLSLYVASVKKISMRKLKIVQKPKKSSKWSNIFGHNSR